MVNVLPVPALASKSSYALGQRAADVERERLGDRWDARRAGERCAEPSSADHLFVRQKAGPKATRPATEAGIARARPIHTGFVEMWLGSQQLFERDHSSEHQNVLSFWSSRGNRYSEVHSLPPRSEAVFDESRFGPRRRRLAVQRRRLAHRPQVQVDDRAELPARHIVSSGRCVAARACDRGRRTRSIREGRRVHEQRSPPRIRARGSWR